MPETEGVVASPPSTMNPTPPTGPGTTPPTPTPGSGEQPAAGEMEQAKSQVQIAIHILDKALAALGSTSEAGQAVHKALGALSRHFSGDRSEDIAPAELMNMAEQMPDQYKQAMAAQMGGGGGAGAPPPGGGM